MLEAGRKLLVQALNFLRNLFLLVVSNPNLFQSLDVKIKFLDLSRRGQLFHLATISETRGISTEARSVSNLVLISARTRVWLYGFVR